MANLTEKKQTKFDKIKNIFIKRKERLEKSLKFFKEMEEKTDSSRYAKEHLIELTQARLEEINGVLTLIDLKYPTDGEYSFINMDVLPELKKENQKEPK